MQFPLSLFSLGFELYIEEDNYMRKNAYQETN